MWGTTAGDMWKLCGHFLPPALEFSECPRVLGATSFSVTSFSWLLKDSDSEDSLWLVTFVCCVRFLCYSIHQPAKRCIFQPPLETRRYVGFWIDLGCNRTFRGWGTCRNMWRQVHRCRFRFCHKFILLLLHPLRHRFGPAYQATILSAASRAEMADVEKMNKIVPLVTCEITSGQNVCELMFVVNVPNLNLGVQINSVKQRIQRNSLGSCHVSHGGISVFDYHFNHGFIVLKDIQHRTGTRMCSAWWNVINVGQIETGVRGWKLTSHVERCALQQVSLWLCKISGFVSPVWWGMIFFNH